MARIGCIQLDIAWEDVEANIARVRRLLQGRRSGDFDVLVLPELWSCGFTMNERAHQGFERGFGFMKTLSQEYQCAVLGGLPADGDSGQENRCYLVEGERDFYYTKMKAFKFAGEHLKYRQGDQRARWPVAGFQLSPFICYDLRFPELPRAMVPKTDLFSYVACWPTARVHHWRQLLIARAIENQAYVVAVNRVGRDGNGLDYPGNSMVIEPSGKILLAAGDREGLYEAEIFPEKVAEIRKTFPFLQDI